MKKRIRRAADPLLDVAAEPTLGRRSVAVERLLKLHRIDLLSHEQSLKLAQAVWSRTDEDGLPKHLGSFRRSAILALPTPEGVDARRVFAEKFLDRPLKTLTQEEQDEDGQSRVSLIMGVLPDLGEITLASANGIEWTPEEAGQIVRRVAEWWQGEAAGRQMQAKNKSPFDFLTGSGLSVGAAEAVNLFASVVIPKLAADDAESVVVVEKLLEEMDAEDVATHRAWVRLLRLKPQRAEAVSSCLRDDLLSRELEPVEYAHWAVGTWHHDHHDGASVPPPPPDLLSTVANLIGGRRYPALRSALEVMEALIREDEAVLTADRLAPNASGLQRLLVELRLRQWADRDTADEVLPRSEVPRHRAAAARLAATAARTLTRRGESAPEPLQAWVDEATADPLPEVRRAVEGVDDEYEDG